jgi:hypothetical protein
MYPFASLRAVVRTSAHPWERETPPFGTATRTDVPVAARPAPSVPAAAADRPVSVCRGTDLGGGAPANRRLDRRAAARARPCEEGTGGPGGGSDPRVGLDRPPVAESHPPTAVLGVSRREAGHRLGNPSCRRRDPGKVRLKPARIRDMDAPAYIGIVNNNIYDFNI